MSVCKNCTREISETEIIKYFEGEGNDDLEQQMYRINDEEPNYDYEPGDKIKPVPLRLQNMRCPNCKNKLNDCPPFEAKVDVEEEWFDDYGHDPDQSSSFCAFSRYKIIYVQAVVAARNAFKFGSEWRTMDASKRGKLLNK